MSLTQASFVDDGQELGVVVKKLKQEMAHQSKRSLQRPPIRCVPIADCLLQDHCHSYVWAGHFQVAIRIFQFTWQSVNRQIYKLVEWVGGNPLQISIHTFWHWFANHLLLHDRPLKHVSQFLGHHGDEPTGLCMNMLGFTSDKFDRHENN